MKTVGAASKNMQFLTLKFRGIQGIKNLIFGRCFSCSINIVNYQFIEAFSIIVGILYGIFILKEICIELV